MSRVIGNASDFYRLRVTRIDVTDEPDLEWRDDILYRDPPSQRVAASAHWSVEAVSLADEDDVTVVAMFVESEEAQGFLEGANEDLNEMTVSAFEDRYFDPQDG